MRRPFDSRSSRPSRRPRLGVEGLEARWTPANISAGLTGGHLSVTADMSNAFESITVVPGAAPGSVRIMGDPGTLVNDSQDWVVFKNVSSLRINLKGGDDAVAIFGVRLPGNLTFLGGDGANRIGVAAAQIGGNLSIVNGSNSAAMRLVTIDGDVAVTGTTTITSGGTAPTNVNVNTNVTLGRGLTINNGSGDDVVGLDFSVTVGGPVTVNQGGGFNYLELINASVAGPVSVTGGGFDDRVYLIDATVLGSVSANLGNGNNFFTIDPFFGATNNYTTQITGRLNVNTGSGSDAIAIGGGAHVRVGGAVSVRSGSGDDVVSVDDTEFAAAVAIDLGNGNNVLGIEQILTANAGTTFGSRFSARGGAGEDSFLIGVAGDQLRNVKFATAPLLDGGGATNILYVMNYSIDDVPGADFHPKHFGQIVN
jgi:large repetitive protein